MPNLEIWSPRVLSLLRIIAALLFIEHGLMKAIGFPAPQPGVPDPLPLILMIAAGLEVVAAVAIAKVEFVADDGPVHGMSAVDQLAVNDRVRAEVLGQIGGAPAVPAAPVTFLRLHNRDDSRDAPSG